MNRQFSLCLLAALLCHSAAATEAVQPSEQATNNSQASISIATESLKLNNEVAELAQRRLQRNDKAIAEELAATTAIKLQRFAGAED